MVMPELDNGLNRQKKSPAQLAIDPDEDGRFVTRIKKFNK